MKKGFTLIELIGVIILLSVIAMVAVPIVDKNLKEGKEKALENQISSIKLSMRNWLSDNPNINLANGEAITLTLIQLKQYGYVDFDIKNPLTGNFFPNDMILKISRNDELLSYDVLIDTGNFVGNEDSKNFPTIALNGRAYEIVNISNDTYSDKGVVAKSSDGRVLTATMNPTSINLNTPKVYTVTYTATDNGTTTTVNRTVKVADIEAPTITISDEELKIPAKQITTFDLLTGVTVEDNYGTPKIKTESNLTSMPGKYTVKYIATDGAGNVSTKTRIVTVIR